MPLKRTLGASVGLALAACVLAGGSARAQESKPSPAALPSGAAAQRARKLRDIRREIARIEARTKRNERQIRRHPELKDERLRENEELARRREKLLAEKLALEHPERVEESSPAPRSRTSQRPAGTAPGRDRKPKPRPLDLLKALVREEKKRPRPADAGATGGS